MTADKNIDLSKLSCSEIEGFLITDRFFITENIVELYNAHRHDDYIRNLLQPLMDQ